ncbi:ribonuclease III [candidate division KSB1 bacterium]|nr:ribonuclease III [candidate division KSB1 bacterium]
MPELYEQFGYHFKNEMFLRQALKHRSYLTCTGEPRIQSNERLELLGDSVLGMVVTEYLFHKYENAEEGKLTNFKSLLVNRKILSEIARDFALGDYIYLNEAEERAGGRDRESILSDAMEAIIGAIYLDGGLSAAQNFIHENISVRLSDVLEDGHLKNYKSLLQEYCQSENLSGPIYKLEDESGPDHEKLFTICVIINSQKIGIGKGFSKKKAEQKAAKETLLMLNVI